MGKATFATPDVVKVVRAGLLAALSDVPVSSRVPPERPAEFVIVQRRGGVKMTEVSDGPQLTIECWSSSDVAAFALAAEVRTALQTLADGTRRADGATGVVIYRYEEFGGPSYLPDPDSTQDRVTWLCRVHARAVA